jgi:hypothetical protein
MGHELPSFSDFCPYGKEDLDARSAANDFLGKSISEVSDLLRKSPAKYMEHFMWMGPKAFLCYFHSISLYLRSIHSKGDSHFFSWLVSVIEYRLDCDPETIIEILDRVCKDLEYCSRNYGKFGVDHKIHVELPDKFQSLLLRVQALLRG